MHATMRARPSFLRDHVAPCVKATRDRRAIKNPSATQQTTQGVARETKPTRRQQRLPSSRKHT
eukprot:15461382-Alexandrium_andersonii.AAC.1